MTCVRYSAAMCILSLIAATQSGCLVAAAAGVAGGTVAYVKGEEEAIVSAGPEQATAAAKAAIEDLKLLLVSHNANAVEGLVKARTLSDKEVTITIKAESSELSRVTVRIGYFGDEAMSLQILEKLKAKLPAAHVASGS